MTQANIIIVLSTGFCLNMNYTVEVDILAVCNIIVAINIYIIDFCIKFFLSNDF